MFLGLTRCCQLISDQMGYTVMTHPHIASEHNVCSELQNECKWFFTKVICPINCTVTPGGHKQAHFRLLNTPHPFHVCSGVMMHICIVKCETAYILKISVLHLSSEEEKPNKTGGSDWLMITVQCVYSSSLWTSACLNTRAQQLLTCSLIHSFSWLITHTHTDTHLYLCMQTDQKVGPVQQAINA